ncbi:hypothetical protein CHS0354_005143 [Potamilus streckersoni]|uniref:Cytochrome P450 n=1 Tax=Potamilus streckersoni TaxID=2493646 RepID=A0AAE0SI74_9BIVA|nr:hypothetical protein CHS0354_005143 [Potamilus streckersoni]
MYVMKCTRRCMTSCRQVTNAMRISHRSTVTDHVGVVSSDAKVAAEVTNDNQVLPIDSIPGPRHIPLFGTIWQYFPGGRFHGMDLKSSMAALYKLYGPVVKESLPAGKTVVHVFHPEDAQTVARVDGRAPIRYAFFMLSQYYKRNRLLPGLITSQGERWRKLRTHVQEKMMKPKSVTVYMKGQEAVADDMIKAIYRMKNSDMEVKDMRDILYTFAAESIGVVCFDTRLEMFNSIDGQSEVENLVSAIKTLMKITYNETRGLPMYLIFNTPTMRRMTEVMTYIRSLAEKYAEKAIQKSKDNTSGTEETEGNLIPYLLSKELTHTDVITIITEFFFAGVDTTAHFLCYALKSLADHQDVQEKLFQEIESLLPNKSPVTLEALSNAKYLKAFIKEAHRFHHITAGTCRTLNEDIVCSGYHIPKGTFVAVHTHWSCTQDTYHTKPEQFLPERWLRDGRIETSHPFASLLFGFGARSCVGRRFADQESSLAIIKILQNFKVEYHHEDFTSVRSITLTPTSPLQFRFFDRQRSC